MAISGAEATNLQRVRLAEVVERSQQFLVSAESTGINVSEFEFYADRSRFEFLVGNLISNAVEHGWADVTINIGDLPDWWYIEDHGQGVPVDHREQVFDSGFTTKTDGTESVLTKLNRWLRPHEWNIQLVESDPEGQGLKSKMWIETHK